MAHYEFLAKRNLDSSYSASVPVGVLVSNAFVDYYTDVNGSGYQRDETTRPRRAKEIEEYISRCQDADIEPKLFELTINARIKPKEWRFESLDDDDTLGFLTFDVNGSRWLSVTDGGTRLAGLQNALAHGFITDSHTIDARIFVGLQLGEEVAQFLLINEKQKRVRTDLSIRVVQRKLDDDKLSEREKTVLETVLPDTDGWRFEASRIASHMNTADDSPWKGLIQMPNDSVTQPVKLQAFLTSLKPLLANEDLKSLLSGIEKNGQLMAAGKKASKTEWLSQVLKNFWRAIADANPRAREEPYTNVLWGSIGVSASHAALAPIVSTVLQSPSPSFTRDDFLSMVKQTVVAEYDYWYSRKRRGSNAEDYPNEKGEATTFIGASGYSRLAKQLEQEWRSILHAQPAKIIVAA